VAGNANESSGMSRRAMLRTAAAAGVCAVAADARGQLEGRTVNKVSEGRLKQSVIHWCFKDHWDVEQTARVARDIGLRSVELVDPKDWPMLKKYGLTCAIAGSHGFVKGMNNPDHWPECLDILNKRIDAASEAGVPSVITFTGMRENIPDDAGATNCVEGFKKVVGHAEKKNVTLCLEMLNSRVNVTMKGHPGYQGDHVDYCIDIIKRVGSPRLKLLFDVYHVQIMDGDVITRFRQYKDLIGHVHTAGVPGRGELDDTQEINYRGIMKAIADAGYQGYVGQEFIPTRDPLEGLRQAAEVCAV
jgi:hydroxypyruvate isomerase